MRQPDGDSQGTLRRVSWLLGVSEVQKHQEASQNCLHLSAVSLHPGKLVWSGEHWISGLRPPGPDSPTAWASLFHTRYSLAGEGNVAQVILASQPRVSFIGTDNPPLCEFIRREFLSKSSVQDPRAEVVNATFQRIGDIRRDTAWIIETASHRVTARWIVTEPPVIAHGSFRAGTEHFTVLFFTNQSTVELDGRAIEGGPYPRDIWKKSIGGD